MGGGRWEFECEEKGGSWVGERGWASCREGQPCVNKNHLSSALRVLIAFVCETRAQRWKFLEVCWKSPGNAVSWRS